MIRFENFERYGVVAAFSEAADGNFSLRNGSVPEAVAARRRFAEACGLDPAGLACVQQVHGTEVVRVRAEDRGRGAFAWEDALGPADALLTDVPGLPVAVLVADCVPVYLHDPARGVAGLVHAGWRGTLDRAAARALEAMRRGWGTDPADVHALLGPSAGPCCYEVSEELAEDFRRAGLSAEDRRVDLWASNARVLAAAGVPPSQIQTAARCTVCDPRFHSHRRDATPNRNMALLALG